MLVSLRAGASAPGIPTHARSDDRAWVRRVCRLLLQLLDIRQIAESDRSASAPCYRVRRVARERRASAARRRSTASSTVKRGVTDCVGDASSGRNSRYAATATSAKSPRFSAVPGGVDSFKSRPSAHEFWTAHRRTLVRARSRDRALAASTVPLSFMVRGAACERN